MNLVTGRHVFLESDPACAPPAIEPDGLMGAGAGIVLRLHQHYRRVAVLVAGELGFGAF